MKHLRKFENFEPYGKTTQTNPSEMKQIELYKERWMKSFDIVGDYEGNGPGTIFGGDSGYIDSYEDLIERLKDDINKESSWIDGPTDLDVEFLRVHNEETEEPEELTTFIKGLAVTFD